MSICIYTGGKLLLTLSASLFSLSWTHSVEKIEWFELWQTENQQLVEQLVKIKGSGAGMEPADNAVLKEGWYQWKTEPELKVKELNLAVSGMTPSAWKLCEINEKTKDEQCTLFDLEGARSQPKRHSGGTSVVTFPQNEEINIKITPECN